MPRAPRLRSRYPRAPVLGVVLAISACASPRPPADPPAQVDAGDQARRELSQAIRRAGPWAELVAQRTSTTMQRLRQLVAADGANPCQAEAAAHLRSVEATLLADAPLDQLAPRVAHLDEALFRLQLRLDTCLDSEVAPTSPQHAPSRQVLTHARARRWLGEHEGPSAELRDLIHALDTRTPSVAADPEAKLLRVEAQVELSATLLLGGDPSGAHEAAREARDRAQKLSVREQLAALNALARAQIERRPVDEEQDAELARALDAAQARAETRHGPLHPITAELRVTLAELLYARGQLEGARDLYLAALDAYGSTHGWQNVASARLLPRLSAIALAIGPSDDALDHARAWVAMEHDLVGRDHPRTALALAQLAGAAIRVQDFELAAEALHQHLAIVEVIGPALQPLLRASGSPPLIEAYRQLAQIHRRRGDRPAMLASDRSALAIAIDTLGDDPKALAESYVVYAGALFDSTRDPAERAEAIVALETAVDLARRHAGTPEHPEFTIRQRALFLEELGRALELQGELERAEQINQEAIDDLHAVLDPNDPLSEHGGSVRSGISELEHAQAQLALAAGREAEARARLAAAIEQCERIDRFGRASTFAAELAELLERAGEGAAALEARRQAHSFASKGAGDMTIHARDITKAALLLAQALEREGHYAEAVQAFIEVRDRSLAIDDERLARVGEDGVEVNCGRLRPREARAAGCP
ncbi:hypothetical protein [Plesiocystis pacifica]|nr:hypothetical protein [Plesiocystis pacifica]